VSEPGPRPTLSPLDGAVIVVGVVLGVGIFRSPPVVAANAGGPLSFLGLWLAGGAISLVGALCYAELATADPDAGGEYHFISRAYGRRLGFFVAWSRMTVIQTGSIALLAFVVGDYLSALVPGSDLASPAAAAGVVLILTGVNLAGIRPGRGAQHVLTACAAAGMAGVIAAGFLIEPPSVAEAEPAPVPAGGASPGLALVFVLLAFGGWSEGAYVSAEIRGGSEGVWKALLWGTGAITVLYLLVNGAFLKGLGLSGMAASDAVAVRLVEGVFGRWGTGVVTGAVVLAALSSANATVMTGARSTYALGRDWPTLGFLGGWTEDGGTPRAALLVQGAVSLLLVGFGALERGGFEAMVAYTAPVFWLVLLFTGASLVVFRRREPTRPTPFRVPLYPITPALFCTSAAYMVYASIRYAGTGALLSLAVLAAGLPVLWIAESRGASG